MGAGRSIPERAPPQPASSSFSASSSSSSSSSSSPAPSPPLPPPPPPPPTRSPKAQLEHEDRLFKVLGLVGGLGFWEAWRLPQVCRELRFGFSGGGAPADMIKLGLERRGVWAKLREARAARRDEFGYTRLHDACITADDAVQRVSELIELGWPGSVDARDVNGWTPLIFASINGLAGIVKALLAAGADVNAAKNDGFTALIWACYHGHLEVARALVASGSNVKAVDPFGRTPLNCARGRDGHANPTIEALLLAAGATAGADRVEGADEGEDEDDDGEDEGEDEGDEGE